jgi:hypothetical protein
LVTWWTRRRADLARPDTSVDRRELTFLAVVTAAIGAAAQLTDAGTPVELLLVIAAVATLVLSAAIGRPPSEIVAVVVTVLLAAALWRDGNLEAAFFVGVLAMLYAAWHLGSVTKALACMAVAATAPVGGVERDPGGGGDRLDAVGGSQFDVRAGSQPRRQRMLIEQLEAAPGGPGRAGGGRGAPAHRPRTARPRRAHPCGCSTSPAPGTL